MTDFVLGVQGTQPVHTDSVLKLRMTRSVNLVTISQGDPIKVGYILRCITCIVPFNPHNHPLGLSNLMFPILFR